MEKYIPDMYQKSIYNINYDLLYDRGIKCLLFDLDNTIVPITIKKSNKKIKELFDSLKSRGFKVILFSNTFKSRVDSFKEELDLDGYSFVMKPLKFNYNKMLKKYKFNVNEVAIIGDQLLTDIKGGNKVGITTILVNPIGTKEYLLTRINRMIETEILKKLRDNDLFAKGKYYE